MLKKNILYLLTDRSIYTILITVINFDEASMREKNVKICKGPGCKAWSSDRIARELREIGEALNIDDVKVCRVPCMNACGGGASIRVGSKSKVVKLRNADEALTVLDINDAVVVAC